MGAERLRRDRRPAIQRVEPGRLAEDVAATASETRIVDIGQTDRRAAGLKQRRRTRGQSRIKAPTMPLADQVAAMRAMRQRPRLNRVADALWNARSMRPRRLRRRPCR